MKKFLLLTTMLTIIAPETPVFAATGIPAGTVRSEGAELESYKSTWGLPAARILSSLPKE